MFTFLIANNKLASWCMHQLCQFSWWESFLSSDHKQPEHADKNQLDDVTHPLFFTTNLSTPLPHEPAVSLNRDKDFPCTFDIGLGYMTYFGQ